ncbi:hypothetical protein TGRUB_433000 [Toxoplasma gondii RUB]|uniref:Uncharacterized protein n=1 Tax=Toxoplasma gondii RUB TaxID=935652 RepID=A0A086LNP6_TOXGO|nr:hypothetical protein TGRUB_433000 [Toxoplasma gondii RUB]
MSCRTRGCLFFPRSAFLLILTRTQRDERRSCGRPSASPQSPILLKPPGFSPFLSFELPLFFFSLFDPVSLFVSPFVGMSPLCLGCFSRSSRLSGLSSEVWPPTSSGRCVFAPLSFLLPRRGCVGRGCPFRLRGESLGASGRDVSLRVLLRSMRRLIPRWNAETPCRLGRAAPPSRSPATQSSAQRLERRREGRREGRREEGPGKRRGGRESRRRRQRKGKRVCQMPLGTGVGLCDTVSKTRRGQVACRPSC